MKVRGYRVELAEIEHAAWALPGVRQVAVVPVRHRGLVELALFYTGSHLEPGDATVALALVAARRYGAALGLRLDDLPLNANRKVDRSALAEVALRRLSRNDH